MTHSEAKTANIIKLIKINEALAADNKRMRDALTRIENILDGNHFDEDSIGMIRAIVDNINDPLPAGWEEV